MSDNENVILTTTESLLKLSATSMLSVIENATDVIYDNSSNSNNKYNIESDNQTFVPNNDTYDFKTEQKEYIFDRKDVRYVFVTLYSLVFCFCFFGKFIIIF